MNEKEKTREELVAELAGLRERIELLETERPSEEMRAAALEEDLRLARTLTEAATDNLDTHEVARILAREIQGAFGSRSVSLYIVSPDQTELEMQSVGLKPGLTSAAERLLGARIPLVRIRKTDESHYWRSLELGETQIYRDKDEIEAILLEFAAAAPDAQANVAGAPRDVVDGVIRLLGFECVVHVPLIARGRVLGLLAVAAHDQYSVADVDRLTSVGQHVASILAAAQAEQDWRRERDRADLYMERAPGFLLVLGTDGTVQSINHVGCEILGLPEDEIIGKSWIDTFVPEARRQFAADRVAASIEGLGHDTFEAPVLTVRGEERRLRWRTSSIHNEGGTVTALLAAGVDLTRIEASERREARSRQRYRALLENSTDLTTILDAEGFFMYASSSVAHLLGYTPDELEGVQAAALIHPGDAELFAGAIRASIASDGVTQDYSMRVRHKDGSWRVLEGTANPQLSNPDISGIILNLRDVTERERIEGSIENSAARFRALIESSHELMMVLGSDLRIRYASPSCSRDLGYSTGALAGLSFEELAHGEDLDRETFKVTGHRGAQIEKRCRLRTEDRRWVPYDVTITNQMENPAIGGFILNAVRARDGS